MCVARKDRTVLILPERELSRRTKDEFVCSFDKLRMTDF